jgi:hypothetical protein
MNGYLTSFIKINAVGFAIDVQRTILGQTSEVFK